MSNINILDTLTLSDNNEYVVTNKTILNDINYFMLVDNVNPANFKFVSQEKDEILEIEDMEEIKMLAQIFVNNYK